MLNYVISYYKPYQSLLCFALIADPNTLFRSNSLSSKAMEQFMKVRCHICCFGLYWEWTHNFTVLIISNLLVNLCFVCLYQMYELVTCLLVRCCIMLYLVYSYVLCRFTHLENKPWCLQHLVLFCCQAVGMLYLHEVLKPMINRIFDEKKYIELDPCKIDLNRTR